MRKVDLCSFFSVSEISEKKIQINFSSQKIPVLHLILARFFHYHVEKLVFSNVFIYIFNVLSSQHTLIILKHLDLVAFCMMMKGQNCSHLIFQNIKIFL